LLIPVQIDLSKPINVGLEEGEEELLVEDDESVCRDTEHAPLHAGEPAVDKMNIGKEAKSDTSIVSKQLRQLEKNHFNELMHDSS
jgi:hypothetical protein